MEETAMLRATFTAIWIVLITFSYAQGGEAPGEKQITGFFQKDGKVVELYRVIRQGEDAFNAKAAKQHQSITRELLKKGWKPTEVKKADFTVIVGYDSPSLLPNKKGMITTSIIPAIRDQRIHKSLLTTYYHENIGKKVLRDLQRFIRGEI